VRDERFRVYVSGLPFSASQQDVRDLAERLGAVVAHVNLPLDVDGRSRGFAFIACHDQVSVDLLLAALKDYEWHGRMVRAEMARART
jgi:RNA recognition motif-containing protein